MHKNSTLTILLACGLISISIVYVLSLPVMLFLILAIISVLSQLNITDFNDLAVFQCLIKAISAVIGIYALLSAWQVLNCYVKTGFKTRPAKIWQIGLLIGLLLLIPLNIYLYSAVWLSSPSPLVYIGWASPSPDLSFIIAGHFLGVMLITAPLLTTLTLTYLLYYPYLYERNKISILVFIIKAGLFIPTAVFILLLPRLYHIIIADIADAITNLNIPVSTLWMLLTGYGLWACWQVIKCYEKNQFATQPKQIWRIGMTAMLGTLLYYCFLIELPDANISNVDVIFLFFWVLIAPMTSILILFSLLMIVKLKSKQMLSIYF